MASQLRLTSRRRNSTILVGIAFALLVFGVIASRLLGAPPAGPDAASTSTASAGAASAEPSASVGSPAASGAPDAQAALRLLAGIPAATTSSTGYLRAAFGPAWQDTNHNGCDTRNDVLARDLRQVVYRAGTHECVVSSGVLDDPYTGTTIDFVRGNVTSEAVQIDHVVPLEWAWRYGASAWTATQRLDFANDEAELLAVDGKANEEKSDSGPANWLPPNVSFQCRYVETFVTTVSRYGLSIGGPDRSAARGVLSRCP